jgi:hypothetical protein
MRPVSVAVEADGILVPRRGFLEMPVRKGLIRVEAENILRDREDDFDAGDWDFLEVIPSRFNERELNVVKPAAAQRLVVLCALFNGGVGKGDPNTHSPSNLSTCQARGGSSASKATK